MAWTYIITAIEDGGEYLKTFGQILFTGTYATGGDVSGTFAFDLGTAGVNGTTHNTAGMPVWQFGQSALHATQPPFVWDLNVESGYIAVLVPAAAATATATNFGIKWLDPATKGEIAAGAYPAAITGAVYNTLELRYKKNR